MEEEVVMDGKTLRKLYQARDKDVIDESTFQNVRQMSGPELAAAMTEIKAAMSAKFPNPIASAFEGLTSGLGSTIGGILSNKTVVVVVLVALFLFSGGKNLIGKMTGSDSAVERSSGQAVEGIDRAAWYKTSSGLEVPVNKAVFETRPLPINVDGQRARIAIVVLLTCLILVAFDNASARPNQAPNWKGNIGIFVVWVAFALWSYWSVVIGVFGLYLCLRSREGEDAKISNKFLLFVFGLWIWFDQIAPIVNGWLDQALNNPNWSWLPPLVRWLFEGENLRPLMFFAIIGFVIWSMISKDNDSSTLIALLAGGELVWFLWKGVFPFWENMPDAARWPFFIALFALAVIAIIVEQVQVGFTQIPVLIGITFIIVFFFSLGIRTYFGIDPTGNTLARWMTQPVIAVYVVILLVCFAFSFAINHQSKVAVGVYNAAVSWFGSLVDVFGIRIPSDGLISLNIVVAALLVFSKYALT